MASSVTSAMGCDVKCTDDSGFQEAVSAAQKAQAVIVVIGLDQSQERSVSVEKGYCVVITTNQQTLICLYHSIHL